MLIMSNFPPRFTGQTVSSAMVVGDLFPPAGEPSSYLTDAVLCFDRGENASDRASKIHAHIALGETSPIALVLHHILMPLLTSRSHGSIDAAAWASTSFKDPDLERNLRSRTARTRLRKCRRSVVTARADASAAVRGDFVGCLIADETSADGDVKRAPTFLRFAP